MAIHYLMDLLIQHLRGKYKMSIDIGKSKNLTLISGPCAIESEKLTLSIAEFICNVTKTVSGSSPDGVFESGRVGG